METTHSSVLRSRNAIVRVEKRTPNVPQGMYPAGNTQEEVAHPGHFTDPCSFVGRKRKEKVMLALCFS